jgi:hypothetical protein
MTDALILTVIAGAYAMPWLVLTAILEATIWKE